MLRLCMRDVSCALLLSYKSAIQSTLGDLKQERFPRLARKNNLVHNILSLPDELEDTTLGRGTYKIIDKQWAISASGTKRSELDLLAQDRGHCAFVK